MSLTGAPIIGEKYQLVTKLGHGTMADVYLGLAEGIEGFAKLAVVKVLRSHLAADPEFSQRFVEEARLAMRLSHPNVVQTYEAGDEGGLSYIAMEFLEGQSLAALQNRIGLGSEKLEFAVQVAVLVEVLAAMEYAHTLSDYDGAPLRVVHRDLAPPNIFITYDGHVKVLDFGIAKALDSAIETRVGLVLGKAGYISPEQALGRDVDGRADLYSVGVMLWEAAAGRRRWSGVSHAQIVAAIVGEDVVELPGAEERGLPARVDEIVERALARDPARRYQDAAEFRVALEELLQEMGREVTPRELGQLISQTFASDRRRLRRELELTLAKHKVARGSVGRPAGLESRLHPPVANADDSTSLSPVSTGALRLSELSANASRRSTTVRYALSGVLMALLVALAGVLVLSQASKRRQLAVAAPSATASASRFVQVELEVQPHNAVLRLDGVRLPENPAAIKRPADDRSHELVAELAGYQTLRRTVRFDSDLALVLAMVPKPTGAASAAPVPPPKRRWRAPAAKAAPTAEPAEPAPAPARPSPPRPGVGPEEGVEPGKPRVNLDLQDPWGGAR